MKRRTLVSALAGAGITAQIGGCLTTREPLRIARHVWPGYEFMFLAERAGKLDETTLNLIDTPSATESMRLLSTGQADGAALTLDEVLQARAQNVPLQVVLVFNISLGADVLLGRPAMADLRALQGRRIGYEATGVGALMLYKALQVAGLRYTDIVAMPLSSDQHLSAWRRGTVDGLITFEPLASQLAGDGARRLYDSSRLPDTIFDVLAVRPAVLENHAQTLRHLIASHFQELAQFRKNPLDAAYRLTNRLALPPKDVIAAYRGLELPPVSRNRQLLQGANAPLVQAARELGSVLLAAGILTQPPADLNALTAASHLPTKDQP